MKISPLPPDALEAQIGNLLRTQGLKLALAESCTGGLVGSRITDVPGSSDYFLGGIVAYAYEAKVNLLGVSWDTLKAYGAVSRETVLAMARGARQALEADIALSVSGTAGPGGGIFSNNGLSVLIFTTVAHNTASGGAEGIYRGGGTTRLLNTIVADNGTTNCSGTIVSEGHNLDSGTSCGLGGSGDITDSDPLLGALREVDGSMVYPLGAGSPAIDVGICIPGIETDQRGLSRPQGDGCDIGAYEWGWYKIYLPLVLNNYQ